MALFNPKDVEFIFDALDETQRQSVTHLLENYTGVKPVQDPALPQALVIDGLSPWLQDRLSGGALLRQDSRMTPGAAEALSLCVSALLADGALSRGAPKPPARPIAQTGSLARKLFGSWP